MKLKEIRKLSDRELLVKTFGELEDIRQLQKAQGRYVTRGELMLVVGIISVIFAGVGALIYF